MTDILQDIIATKQREVATLKTPKPSLRDALLASPTGIIAEFKRRSPSKGWIKEDGRADDIPLRYQQCGAAALSILTDEAYFGGSDDFIRTARRSGVSLPILYKNFVVDELQLYQAVLCGASAVLLIAACLSKERCAQLLQQAHQLGLEVLLEMHDERELEYAGLEPDLCGINNRNLGSFVTDVDNSFRLAERLRSIVGVTDPTPAPPLEGRGGVGGEVSDFPVLVSESGISKPETIRDLRAAGFRGFLIGETFMKTPDPGQALADFIKEI